MIALFHKALTASAHVTVPVPPVVPTTIVTPPPPPVPVEFPLGWLLAHAAAPIQYRAIVDVARLPRSPNDRIGHLPFASRSALMLAAMQRADGTWPGGMLGVPGARAEHFEGVGTVNAVRRLLEYGWDRESPPLARARRILFRLLAEDADPAYLFEFGKAAGDEELVRHYRLVLREAAAAALAQMGYEGDPRLRGAARRLLDRVHTYLKSPLAQKPWVRVGNRQVLPPEAAPPSIYLLTMLAFMPQFRSECHEQVDRIYQHLSQPQPRQEAAQLRGGKIVAVPHYVLGDLLPTRNTADDDVPFAIVWLELMARLGYLRRNEGWMRLFERFLDDRDAQGVWHPHKGLASPRSGNPYVWPLFPLEESAAGDERWSDITFRLGLIARFAGRPLDVV
jgi:hypothetical protein